MPSLKSDLVAMGEVTLADAEAQFEQKLAESIPSTEVLQKIIDTATEIMKTDLKQKIIDMATNAVNQYASANGFTVKTK